ncbi:N-terminal domain of peptidoglycan hydrolase CwlO-containing protein [Nitrosomonas cryotolerans]|uniref:N-terminal domain of peptidoglycan hydrolase CwlO-containing protein n=2 Tax=Nitrosomonas cryotolerans TaxID=44575 RepID=A0A1N6IVJ8_9PROT|nr:N-terminal domain of peptidoglycan hydrolase CwlO-containing protein [Nitrosomonas cryotolerans]SIO36060.1 N-terminal domain of peptidoglycan hydrolase CwlO-containing protein [Nitrosomonas cryotolerans ATCC 49181]
MLLQAFISGRYYLRYYALVCLLALISLVPTLHAQEQIPDSAATASDQSNDIEMRHEEAIARLSDIQQSLQDKRKQLAEQQQLIKSTQENEKKEVQQHIDTLNTDIAQLNQSFEQIIIGGLDLEPFSDTPARPFDWREELIQATRPIIDGLKDLTEKPRKIEKLRNNISRLKEQNKLIRQALKSIAQFKPDAMTPLAQAKSKSIAKEWEQRQIDNERNLEIAHYQLTSLQGTDSDWWQNLKSGLTNFAFGRGLTLITAIVAALGVWQLMNGLFWLYQKKLISPSRRNSMQVRLIGYAYRILTGLLVILAIIMTFYLASDFLLLTLGIILLVAIVLSFRQILPHYIAETRLLLDMGPVRVGERVVYNGLPMQVKSINVHSLLRNPDLKGIVRLPLRALDSMISRPVIDEPWFPCQAGEYVLLPDGRLGLVLQQTLELVQLQIAGSLVQFPATDFFRLDLYNLSRQGFGLAVTFGIDYQHQTECLDAVPIRFREALIQAFEKAELNNQVLNLMVDFKEAGVNSLDYLIFINFNSEIAGSYFMLRRLIQKTCVEVCNRENWVIPFPQLVLHQGDGFQAMREQNNQSSGKSIH